MKKRLTLLSLLLLFTMTAMAQTLVDGIYYNLNGSDNTAEVTNGTECSGDIVIPASISVDGVDYSVTSIGSYAFDDCSGLTSIVIPNSVTSIGDDAFYCCSGLTSIVIPNSVTAIGDDSFYNCSGLTSIKIPNSVTSIGESAFSSCSSLTSIEIPNSVTSIGESAFYNCDALTSIKIPNSVTSIGKYAFRDCSGLTSIEIPNSVTSIGDCAFSDCSGLTSIEIPNSVTSIGNSAFSRCSCLTSIVVEEGNSYYDSRENCNAIIETASNKLIVGCQNTIIPNSVTSIGDCAFQRCSGLTSIEIPTSVTSIGSFAFDYCSGLTSIEIPNSVTSIGDNAFQRCSSLTSITMQRTTPPTVGANLIYNCSKLETIYVPVGAAEAYNVAPWNDYNIVESALEVSEVTFDFQGNPWELPLGSGSDEDAGNVEEITQDGVVLSLEQLSASTHPRMWTGPQLRVYKKNQLTVKAPAGKVVTKAVWTATGASYYGLTVNDEAVDATAGWSGAQAEVPFVVSVNGRYNTLVVTLANEESTSGIPENTPNYVPRHNGRKTRSDRNVTAVKLTGEYSGEQVYTLTSAEQSQDYTDVTASVVFQVEPGEELTPKVEQLSDWMHHAVYIDTDKNGFTGAIAAGSEWKPAGDLVSYSFYNNDAADDDKGWNSVGDVLDWSMVVYPPLPAFTAPTEPGIYRMRFVQDWCSIDPAGDADGKFGDFKKNGGQIVDVMLEVLNHVYLTDGEAYTNATEKETERITYTREFNNTQWQSWYVPFDMDYNDISDEYTAACLNDIHEYDDDEDGVLDRWTMEVLILRPGETIYANLPYVIRAKAVGEKQFVVENTMLYPADEQSMDCSSMRMHYTFTGTYSPIEAQVLRDNGWLAMGNGRLVTPTITSKLKANRWYLESTPRKGYGSTYQAPKRIELVVVDENGEVTGVEELPLTEDENAVWPADVYDLNGRLVKAQAKNLNELSKGVYIVRGEKIVK